MPIDYRFDAARSLLIVIARGAVGDEVMMEFARKIAEDTSVPSDCQKYIDLCGLEESTVSPAVIRRAAELLSSSGAPAGPGRTAMVAGRDFAYGLARMYQSYRSLDPERFRVFRDAREALDWLGVETGDLP